MNPPGDPRSYHKWSVWWPMDSLRFAENVSEWKWTDDSTDALISIFHWSLVKCRPRLVHFDHFYWLHGLSRLLIGRLPRTETDHPTINHRWSVRRARILHFLQHWHHGEIMKLTHWGRDKIAAIPQTTFSNAFSWIKIYKFWLKFHWSLFLEVQLTICQHWFR